jgi:hypothetical protein
MSDRDTTNGNENATSARTSPDDGAARGGSGGQVEERAARADESGERSREGGTTGDEGSSASRPHGRTDDPDRTL